MSSLKKIKTVYPKYFLRKIKDQKRKLSRKESVFEQLEYYWIQIVFASFKFLKIINK